MWQEISKTGPKPAFNLDAGKYSTLFFVGRRALLGWVWAVHPGTTEYYWDNTLCAPAEHQIGCKWTHWLALPAIIVEGDQHVAEVTEPAQPDPTGRRRLPVRRARTKPAAPKKRVSVDRNARHNLRRGAR